MAHTEMFAGTLSGLNENPPNSSEGIGTTLVTVDLDLFTMRIQSTWTGMSGTVTASHIHVPTSVGANGPVATQTPSFPGFPTGVTSGSYDQTFDMTQTSSYNSSWITSNGGTVTTAFNALLLGLQQGRAYHNIHSNLFPGGELRANLTAVPEPASMTALGLALTGVLARRRKKS